MEKLSNPTIDSEYDSYNNDELLDETPVGWSSMCLNETIHYYIECNFVTSSIKNEQSFNE